MDEEDFLLDEEEYDLQDRLEEEEEDEDLSSSDDEIDSSAYKGKLSNDEVWFIRAYDDITKSKELEEAALVVIMGNPFHSSTATASSIIKEMFNLQGHNRIQATKYSQGPLHGEDVRSIIDEETDDVDTEVNEEIREEVKSMIHRFIGYLANRDLSEDSLVSKKRKMRQLPAFIILMFSKGYYDYVINCPTMPQVYSDQITYALKKLDQQKYEILENMAKRYEEKGRPEFAKKARELGLSWFYYEPAALKTLAEFKDIITQEDIDIYREFRPQYTNISKAITQEVISDYIELDLGRGQYEKLKDKTRGDAINDVKRVFRDWSETYEPENKNLASKLIFNGI